MSELTKADLLKPKITTVEIGEGCIHIRALNAAYAVSLRGKTLGDEEIFDMLSRSICDEAGTPMLTPAEVGQMDLKTLQVIVNAALEFNSLSEGASVRAADALKKTSAANASPMSSP